MKTIKCIALGLATFLAALLIVVPAVAYGIASGVAAMFVASFQENSSVAPRPVVLISPDKASPEVTPVSESMEQSESFSELTLLTLVEILPTLSDPVEDFIVPRLVKPAIALLPPTLEPEMAVTASPEANPTPNPFEGMALEAIKIKIENASRTTLYKWCQALRVEKYAARKKGVDRKEVARAALLAHIEKHFK